MRVLTVEAFRFQDLEDEAKERAREWYRNGLEYPWFSESIDSIRAFAKHFGVSLMDWEIGGGRNYIKTDATNANFRGVRLDSINRDHMPTGYCLDADLWEAFYDEFKKTGDAKHAFEQALEAALCAVQRDIEYQYSNEAVDESLRFNEYEFNSDGSIFTAKEMEIA
jgi:hypothetical protein